MQTSIEFRLCWLTLWTLVPNIILLDLASSDSIVDATSTSSILPLEGAPPGNVTDFSCKVADYEFMLCKFTKPPNMLDTKYMLQVTTNLKDNPNKRHTCELLEMQNMRYCNLTSNQESERQLYLPMRNTYYFILNSSNALGTTSQVFAIKNHQNVVPAKFPIQCDNIASGSITLSWNITNFAYYRGLKYEIQLEPKGFKSYHYKDYDECQDGNNNCSILIKNLYPYWEYKVSLRSKVKTAKNDTTMWSEATSVTFRTEPRSPNFPPITAVGGYFIEQNEKRVRLFWQHLKEHEKNGPQFHYLISELDANNEVVNISKTSQPSIALPLHNGRLTLYNIRAANSKGASIEASLIKVYPDPVRIPRSNYAPQKIDATYFNRTYTLTWQPPVNSYRLNNYTIFWCVRDAESSYQCKGPINFEYVNFAQTNFTTQIDNTINMAISANFINYNSGMHWALCTADIASELIKLQPETDELTESVVRIKWNSGYVCPSILKGYKLTYCEISTPLSNCTGTQIVRELSRDSTEFQIRHLKPYSYYLISMLMYSDKQDGPISDLTVRTQQSAPSAPRNLKITSVTSGSATISWQPPTEFNGILQYYTVWKTKNYPYGPLDTENVTISEKEVPNEWVVFELKHLSSYSEYTIFVTAHTVEQSELSNHVKFLTLVGVPSTPRNISFITTGDFSELSWEKPELPSGRLEFYAVKLKSVKKAKGTDDSTKDEVIKETISLVAGNQCRLRVPECNDSSTQHHFYIRAVNVAGLQQWNGIEQNNDTIDLVTSVSGFMSTKAAMYSVQLKLCSSPNSADYFCINEGTAVQESFCSYLDIVNDNVMGEYEYFSSPWSETKDIYQCSIQGGSLSKIIFLLLLITCLIALVGLVSYTVLQKFIEMKNIRPILPEGLVNHIANYKMAGGGGSCVINSSNPFQEPYDTPFSSKENHHLLTSMQKASINPDHMLITKAYNESNDDQSSQSTNSVELNDASVPPLAESRTNRAHTHPEYTVPQSKLSTVYCSNERDSGRKPAYGDYVDPSAAGMMVSATQQPTNGYSKLDDIRNPSINTESPFAESSALYKKQASQNIMETPSQLRISNDFNKINSTETEQPPVSYAEANVSTNSDAAISVQSVTAANKKPSTQNFEESPPLLMVGNDDSSLTNNRNYNNNLICGYVTQRQLAELGQLLH